MDQERAQSRSLDAPDEHRDLPRAGMDIIRLGDLLAVRATFQPGWRWSTDMGPRMGTTSCPVTHRGILLAGRMRVEMDSGEVVDVEPGSIQVIPAGHDAFVVGDEPAVMVDFSSSADEIGQPSAGERVVSTLLFTDIVGSTTLAERLGDQQWKHLVAEHDRFLGDAVNRFRGRVVKTTGDGVFARFDGAARALHAAAAMVAATAPLDIEIRVGVHTGEVELVGEDVRGVAIHEAARIMALAQGGEILVSDLTRQLATGAGLTFEDRGEVELRGVSGTRRLFRLGMVAAPG
jgi:class 3 adenylate cyclase